jgi:membrane-associated phospholipid phosphatase
MSQTFDWGVRLILWLQHFSPVLDWPFRAFTLLGEEDVLMLLLPLFFWCYNRRVGARLAMLFLFSSYINCWAKVLLSLPRPFEYSSLVRQLYPVTGYGFPSGHTQSSVVIWGYLAAVLRRTWFWILAALLMGLGPLSRLFLGLHFPIDLLGGYAIGGVLLLLYLALEPRLEPVLARLAWPWQLALAVAVPLLLLVLLPTNDESAASSAGVLFGMGIGFVAARRWCAFRADGPARQRVLRFLLGGAVLLALRFGLKAAFDGLEPVMVWRVLRYGLIGLWAALGAPWAFLRLRLADAEPDRVAAAPAQAVEPV